MFFSYLQMLQFNFQKVGIIGKLMEYSLGFWKNLKIVNNRHKVPFVVTCHLTLQVKNTLTND